MSASGVYAPPFLRPLPVYVGPERRSATTLTQLSRELDQGCLQVSSPLELAVWLETLGYTAPYLQTSLGVANTFELAETLYTLTQPARVRRKVTEGLRPVQFLLSGLF